MLCAFAFSSLCNPVSIMTKIPTPMKPFLCLLFLLCSLRAFGEAPPKPEKHGLFSVAGWTVRVDERLLTGSNHELGQRALKLLEARLTDVAIVVAPDRLAKLRDIPIILDLTHGELIGRNCGCCRMSPARPRPANRDAGEG